MRGLTPYIVLEELYYIPLFLGVLWFGLQGGVATYLLVALSYIPFSFDRWSATFPQQLDTIIHLLFNALFVVVVVLFVERDRKKHRQAAQERYFSGIGKASTVIVHDLKNPLISILGFAKRIQQNQGDREMAAQVILESAQTMQKIVNDVLEFARPIRLNSARSDIGKCIQRAGESCRIKIDQKGVILKTTLPPEPLLCEADTFLLERALVNLIDNSVDASPRGGTVAVSAVGVKNYVSITINDHGSGMNQETLDNLFMLSYTTKNDGTGFGVPISRKIVEAHGGAIRITSQSGAGTKVVIDLPVKGAYKP